MTAKLILSLNQVEQEDKELVGEKAYSQSLLFQKGFPVPDGFVITSDAFSLFLKENNLESKIAALLSTLNSDDPEDLLFKSHQIKKLIQSSSFPPKLKSALLEHFLNLEKSSPKGFWKLGSTSQTVQIQGEGREVVIVTGEANFTDAVRKLWSEEFSPSSLKQTRRPKGQLLVQKTKEEGFETVFYSQDEQNADKTKMVLVKNQDRYLIDRKNTSLIDAISLEKTKIERATINQLVELFLDLEKHHFFPIEVRFNVIGDTVTVTQVRPLTHFKNTQIFEPTTLEEKIPLKQTVINGTPFSPGSKRAPGKHVKDYHEARKKVKHGDILITQETSNNFLDVLKKTSGLITLKGDRHSHASVFARKRGIPHIVIGETETKFIRDGHVVTINGITGEVII